MSDREPSPRRATVERKTTETEIKVDLTIDGTGRSVISTGMGFLDHMLTLFAKHGFFDLEISAQADLRVDAHHAVEDVGICLGQAFGKALGEKRGIARYGHAFVPMDETLVRTVVDLSGRAYLVYKVEFRSQRLGDFETELVEEHLRGFTNHIFANVHTELLYGKNGHHIAEATFKSLARALAQACAYDPRVKGILTTKGLL
ncbi:MAG: imidazoleglycerol-phosphate dehydratase HisB [Acidobacteriota bacterium]